MKRETNGIMEEPLRLEWGITEKALVCIKKGRKSDIVKLACILM